MNNKAYFGGVVVSHEADCVARELIQDFQIQKLYNLAFMLNINRCFDDHQALRLWVQRLLDEEHIHLDELARHAHIRLINLIQ